MNFTRNSLKLHLFPEDPEAIRSSQSYINNTQGIHSVIMLCQSASSNSLWPEMANVGGLLNPTTTPLQKASCEAGFPFPSNKIEGTYHVHGNVYMTMQISQERIKIIHYIDVITNAFRLNYSPFATCYLPITYFQN